MNREAAIKLFWRDKCTLIVQDKKVDPVTHITNFTEKTIAEEIPCKLSFSSLSAAGEGSVAAVSQSVKLFLSNEIEVPAGSKIVVTRRGKEYLFQRSGLPGIFLYHQELLLEAWKGWA